MEYRSFINSVVLSCCPLMTMAAYSDESNVCNDGESSQVKNVLFIAVDDMKPLLGCYGDKIARTPVMDELAEQGSIFLSSYCQQAISGPSRASLLTGMCPDRTRVWDLETLIRDENPDVITLPQHFKDNGYIVAGYGKIYDIRSVGKMKDRLSWSVPFTPEQKFLNKDYKDLVLYSYQDPKLKKLQADIRKEGKEKGWSQKEIMKQINAKCKVSTECLDVPDDAYFDGSITNGAIDFLNKYDGSKPFFLAVGYKRPHLPFVAPKKYWDLYNRDEMPLAAYRKKAKNTINMVYHKCGELQLYSDITPIFKFTDVANVELPENKQKELIHGYYACVSYVDAQVGEVVNKLREKGLDKNTVIILWGDHGWHLGDHGQWCKHSNFEQAAKTPLIIIDPSGKKNNKVNNPVEFLDIYPTLCDLAGISKPSHLDGESLAGVVKGESKESSLQPYAVSQYPRWNVMGYSIRDSRYRYTIWVDWKDKKTNVNKVVFEELYDYKKDPNETVNVAKDKNYSSAKAQMVKYWKDYQKRRINNL